MTIPNSVTSIGGSAFEGCSGLERVNISDLSAWCNINYTNALGNPLYYAHHLFLDGAEVTNLVIPEIVTEIKFAAFFGCTGLTEVAIPNSVTSIGRSAFCDCSGLTSVTIGNSVTSIGYSAFCDCSGLTSVTIGNSVTSIYEYAFCRCSGLTEVIIPNSVTTIGRDAFSSCDGLVKSAYPNSISNPFSNGVAVAYPTDAEIEDGIIWGANKSAIYFVSCKYEEDFNIPNSVTSIGSSAFANCNGLKWIESKANTPPTIQSNTFSDYSIPLLAASDEYKTADHWKNFTTIAVSYTPTSTTFEVDGLKYEVISVNYLTCRLYAVNETVTGENVVIPETVVYKNRTFTPIEIKGILINGESSVKTLSIPNSITTVNNGIMFNSSLEKLIVNTPITTNFICASNVGELVVTPSVNNFGADLNTKTRIERITIEDSETALPTAQFKCDTKEVYLGRNVSASTFKDMTALEKVTISGKVTSIGEYAFSGCTGLTEVTIPNSVTSISSYAFYGCTGLTEVTIPNSVTSISSYAFQGCTGLAEVTIPNSVTSIYEDAFSGCTELTEVTIPNSVTSIYGDAFRGCTGLTSLNFEDGKGNLTIGTDAFADVTPTEVYFGRQIDFSVVSHTAFETVEFGENVTSIESGAFKDGTAIRTVVSRNTTPPTTDDTFCNETYLDGVLYVPDASIEAYQAAAGWKNFWEVKPLSEYNGVDEIVVDNAVDAISVAGGAICVSGDVPVRIVAINGRTVYSGRGDARVNVTPGIYVVIVGNTAHKVAVR